MFNKFFLNILFLIRLSINRLGLVLIKDEVRKEAIEGIYQKFKKELTLHLQHKLNILEKIRNGEIVETASTKESEFGR